MRSWFRVQYFGLPLSTHHLRGVDFQFIVDKMENKLPIGQRKYVTTTGGMTLIKSVTASQEIYPLTT
jgi:hypothetical protein